MSENQAAAAKSGDAAAEIKSEKSKDIRQTNIIAAKGNLLNWSRSFKPNHSPNLADDLSSCA